MLGKLTLQGQVQRRLVKESDQRPERGETGAVLFFWDRTVSMRECLKEFFLDLIYAAVILRAINEPRFGHLQVRYETNLLTHLLHSMPLQCRLSPNSGTRRKAVCRFIHDGSDEQDTWLLLNHLSVTIARKCITDIARIGENKNVSFEDQQQTLEKILASQSDGKYRLAPIKKSV